MKKTTISAFLGAATALLALVSPATAGLLTLDEGSPMFNPDSAFTNNTIEANVTIGPGALIDLTGSATVNSDSSELAMIEVSGSYAAAAGDIFSIAYKFAADLNSATPVNYTLEVSLDGVPLPPITGTIEPGLHNYEGSAQSPIPFLADQSGVFNGTLTLNFASTGNQPLAAAPGTLDLIVQQIDFKLDPIPASVTGASVALNISTRANVGTGENVVIGGFIVTGTDAKLVVLRGIGPSIDPSLVMGTLADPMLELYNEAGDVIASNDNWMDNSSENQIVLTDNALAPTENAEAAIVTTLDPGSYTVILSGVSDTTGVAFVDAYDLDNDTTDSKLANISTRAMVGTGEDVMIGGFTLGSSGGGITTVVLRGIGPSLADQVSDVLADPTLELFDADGNMIDSNDNWMDDPNEQQVADADLAPSDPNEAALYKILPAGQYTVIVAGAGGTSGVALVEAFEISGPSAGPAK